MLNDEITINITRPKLTDYQDKILYSPARYTVTEASTKVGKTFSHLWWLFEQAHQPPKDSANYWWVAPVFQQAKIAFTRLRRTVAQTHSYRINESELYIETPIGTTIWFKTAKEPDNLYGEDVFAAVFDEFTRAKEEAWTALRTTLTATKAPCKFIGNVKGKHNWGYRLAMKARSNEPGYEYFKVTAYDAVKAGILEADEVEQAKRDLPDHAFRELYLAEALDDQANPFSIQHIKKCIKPISNLEPAVFGVDLAKSIDWTVIIGLDDNGDICYFERWQSDWAQTRRRLIDIIGSKPTYVDSTGVGDPITEDIQLACGANVEGYNFTSTSKQQIMEGLASAIQRAEIGILAGIIQDELEAFEFVYTHSGVRYSAPEGVHDDCVCALALARHRYKDKPGPPTLSFHR